MRAAERRVAMQRALISTAKALEIKFWKNPDKGLEKAPGARQKPPISWGLQKLANASIGAMYKFPQK
jgi:hypothetical protein